MGAGAAPVVRSGLADAAELLKPVAKSMARTLEESPIGKSVSTFLRDELEPIAAQEAQKMIGTTHPRTGLPITPVEAGGMARDQIFDSAFGKNRSGLIPILKIAERQGGKLHAVEMAHSLQTYLADSTLWQRQALAKPAMKMGISSIYQDVKPGERILKDWAAPAFLNRISIPHAFQAAINSITLNGWKDFAYTLKEFGTSPSKALALGTDAGAMFQETRNAFVDTLKKQASPKMYYLRNVLDPMRNAFSFERKWGIAFSAVNGKWSAIHAAEEFANTGSNRSMIQLKYLGLDPQAVISQGGVLTKDQIERAAYRAADEIMGMQSRLETPYIWHTNPLNRMMSLYKNYSFRTGRLLKNAYQRAYEGEGMWGVAKLSGRLGTTYFLAGELTKVVEDAIMGRKPWNEKEQKNRLAPDWVPDPLNEFIDGLAHAGGLGMTYGMMRSARYNNLAGYFLGPVISTGFELTQDLAMGFRTGKFHQLEKDILRRFGLPGQITAEHMVGDRRTGYRGYRGYKAYEGYKKPKGYKGH